VSEISIRGAQRRDVPAILDIEKAQFPEPWSRAMLLEEITNTETRRYRVAIEGGALVGYLGAMFILDEGHVNTLATAPASEGHGVATALLEDFLAAAHHRGTRKLSLEVAVGNSRAQDLYRRFGFAPVGVRRRYYERTGEDALVLWRDLDVTPEEDA
jgi:ribosomal-protein-alanine N-acetyltransferase